MFASERLLRARVVCFKSTTERELSNYWIIPITVDEFETSFLLKIAGTLQISLLIFDRNMFELRTRIILVNGKLS